MTTWRRECVAAAAIIHPRLGIPFTDLYHRHTPHQLSTLLDDLRVGLSPREETVPMGLDFRM